jgi:hypothetical protein
MGNSVPRERDHSIPKSSSQSLECWMERWKRVYWAASRNSVFAWNALS